MSPATHLVLIPSYNTGPVLARTVASALAEWPQVWVVIDASTDRSGEALEGLKAANPGLRVITLAVNGGKGAAVLAGAALAAAQGFSHALVMDADGQHPPEQIRPFIEASISRPGALVIGRPIFGPDAPKVRLLGRKLSVALVYAELLGAGVDDPLFGFRVYPIGDLLRVMERTAFARRYDFDPELAVRLVWSGIEPINLDARCLYLAKDEGGVSHFRYVRDNARMVWLHVRLISELLLWRWTQAGNFGNRRR